MKKLIALFIALMLFAVPVLSFAESNAAQRTVVKLDVNESFLSMIAGENGAALAPLLNAYSLGLHSQSNQFCAELNASESTLANLIFEMTEKDLLIGSNLLGTTAIQISLEELFSAMSAYTGNNTASASVQMNFDHTAAVVQESLAADMQAVENWDKDSDPAVSALSISISSENFLKVMDAVFEDFKANGVMDQILASPGMKDSGMDADQLIAQAKKEIAAALQEGKNALELYIGLDEAGAPVYFSGDIYFMNQNKNSDLYFFAARHSTDSLVWNGGVINIPEGDTEYNGFGFNVAVTQSDVNAEVIFNQYDESGTLTNSTMKVAFNFSNNADFALTVSPASEGSFVDMFTLSGIPGNNSYKVALAVAGIEGDAASLTCTTESAEPYDSIAGYETISLKDLQENEEIQTSILLMLITNLQSVFGS